MPDLTIFDIGEDPRLGTIDHRALEMQEVLGASRSSIDNCGDAGAEAVMISDHAQGFRFTGMVDMHVHIDQPGRDKQASDINSLSRLVGRNRWRYLGYLALCYRHVHRRVDIVGGVDYMPALQQQIIFWHLASPQKQLSQITASLRTALPMFNTCCAISQRLDVESGQISISIRPGTTIAGMYLPGLRLCYAYDINSASGDQTMADFSGQVAIITGASGLLASGVIPVLREAGAKLALTCGDDRLYERFPDLQDDANHLCLQAIDLSDAQAVDGFIAAVLDRFGRIDVLVNIVGGWDAGAPVHEMSIDTWNTMIRLNSTITFLMSRAVIPTMLASGGGAIINIGARPGLRSSGNDAAYAASKAAVLRLTESMSEEYKRQGIRVNAVLPSAIVSAEAVADDPQAGVTPEQIGRVIRFLASDDGAAIRGAIIPVYGSKF